MTRQTKQRAAILELLRGDYIHLTADQIYDEVRKKIRNISKGTVYRNLKVLQEMGLVSEVSLTNTVSRFEAKRHGHYHFRCEGCGQVFDVDEPINRELNQRIAERTGFKISNHQLEFRGLCQECQKK
jgi:Fe2+ or Zn2+ uptake regulation protein